MDILLKFRHKWNNTNASQRLSQNVFKCRASIQTWKNPKNSGSMKIHILRYPISSGKQCRQSIGNDFAISVIALNFHAYHMHTAQLFVWELAASAMTMKCVLHLLTCFNILLWIHLIEHFLQTATYLMY